MVPTARMAFAQGMQRLYVLVSLTLSLDQGVAQFHLDKLIPDLHFNDSTLVTAPCNSPEQVPITFGKEVHTI